MKTVSSGFVIAFATVALLFGTGVGPVQAALYKSQTVPRHAAAQHRMIQHPRTAANECLAKPGSMRALFCAAPAPSASAKK
jgi:hypothetical protein